MSKKVLFVTQNLSFPEDRRVMQEALAVLALGWEVSLIAPLRHGQKKEDNFRGIFVFRYPAVESAGGFGGYLKEYFFAFCHTFFLALKIYFLRSRFSVIHVANPPDLFFPIGAFFKLFGVRFIYDQHDLVPEMFLAKFGTSRSSLVFKVLRLAEKLSYLLATVHIATCQTGLDFFLEKRGLTKKTAPRSVDRYNNHGQKGIKTNSFSAPQNIGSKSVVVRTAPDLSLLDSTKASLGIKKKLADFKKQFSVTGVYLGVMGYQDGLDKLLKSIALFLKKSQKQNVGFLLLGTGDALPELKALAKKLGIEKQVLFFGWVKPAETATCLEMADFGLMPEPKNDYTDHSLHNKVLEYLAFGLPFAAYNLKEVKNNGGKAALYATNNSEEDYAQKMTDLVNNLADWKERGQKRKLAIQSDYSLTWENSAKELQKVYSRLEK